MSETPFYFLLAVLGLILVVREVQHMKLEKALLDRLMVKQGLDPLPEMTVIPHLAEDEPEDVKKNIERTLRRIDAEKKARQIVFKVPGMPHSMGDLTQGAK